MAHTLTDRHDRILDALRCVELANPLASPAALLELACARLARHDGIAVHPAEVTRVLSQAAGFVEGPL